MYNQGDIVLIPIPFSDLTSQKQRPVLVLSRHDYNYKFEDIVVAAITSNITEKEYSVLITNLNMEEGTLKVDSSIRTDKIYTLSQKIVLKKFGKVKTDTLIKVREKINKLIEKEN